MNSDVPGRRRKYGDEIDDTPRFAAGGQAASVDRNLSAPTAENSSDRLPGDQDDDLADLHARLDEVLELLGTAGRSDPTDDNDLKKEAGEDAANTAGNIDDADETARSAIEGSRKLDRERSGEETEQSHLPLREPWPSTLDDLGARLRPLLATSREMSYRPPNAVAAGFPETGGRSSALARLEEKAAELAVTVEAVSRSREESGEFDSDVETILRRLDALVEQSTAAEQLDQIRSEIADIRRSFVGQDSPELASLENKIADLSHRLGAAIEADRRGSAVIDPEEWVARIAAAETELSMPRIAGEAVQSGLRRIRAFLHQAPERQHLADGELSGRCQSARFVGAPIDTPLVAGREQKELAVRSHQDGAGSVASPPRVVPRSELAALRELVDSPAAEPAEADSGGMAAFVASARRAAAERKPRPDEEAPVATNPGRLSRLGRTIRGRRRTAIATGASVAIIMSAVWIHGDAGTVVISENADRPIVIEPNVASAPPVDAKPIGEGTAVRNDPRVALAFAMPAPFESRFDQTPITPPARAFVRTGFPAVLPPLDERIGSAELRRAAASGNLQAAVEVAAYYAEGRAVPRDMQKAAQWYEVAAEKGAAVAQYRLASLYQHGRGVAPNRKTAAAWYRRAAEQGVAEAMHNLAVLLSEELGYHDQAAYWFRAAANRGLRDSQFNLGIIYARGLAEEQDLVESYKWFALAAASGDTAAVSRRDEVATALSEQDLDIARATVKRWKPAPDLALADAMTASSNMVSGLSADAAMADRNALVVRIQTLLAERGYKPGPADGLEGPKTREAVRAFQRQVGLSETGAISRDLVAVLADQSG